MQKALQSMRGTSMAPCEHVNFVYHLFLINKSFILRLALFLQQKCQSGEIRGIVTVIRTAANIMENTQWNSLDGQAQVC